MCWVLERTKSSGAVLNQSTCLPAGLCMDKGLTKGLFLSHTDLFV